MPIATDPLSLLFIASFSFGLLFLLITALLGGLGHGMMHHIHIGGSAHGTTHIAHPAHVHAHHGTAHSMQGDAKGTGSVQGSNFSLFAYLNPISIVLFLLWFGFFGYILHNSSSLILPITLILAGVGGLVLTTLFLMLLGRVFGDSEGETVQDVSDRTGLIGKVSLPIQENGVGEIIYISPGGMRKSIPARSVDGRQLERDQEVVVVNYQQGVAEVDTWEHFIHQDSAASTDEHVQLPGADELAELRALLEESSSRTDPEYIIRKDVSKE